MVLRVVDVAWRRQRRGQESEGRTLVDLLALDLLDLVAVLRRQL